MTSPTERCGTCGRSVYCSSKDAPRIGIIANCGKQLAGPWSGFEMECTAVNGQRMKRRLPGFTDRAHAAARRSAP